MRSNEDIGFVVAATFIVVALSVLLYLIWRKPQPEIPEDAETADNPVYEGIPPYGAVELNSGFNGGFVISRMPPVYQFYRVPAGEPCTLFNEELDILLVSDILSEPGCAAAAVDSSPDATGDTCSAPEVPCAVENTSCFDSAGVDY